MALGSVWMMLLITGSVHVANGNEHRCTKGPVPRLFTLGLSYPFCTEEESCGAIENPISRYSTRFNQLVRCRNPRAIFLTNDCRVMSVRLHAMFIGLANEYYLTYGLKLTVIKSWTEYESSQALHGSLHYEG